MSDDVQKLYTLSSSHYDREVLVLAGRYGTEWINLHFESLKGKFNLQLCTGVTGDTHTLTLVISTEDFNANYSVVRRAYHRVNKVMTHYANGMKDCLDALVAP